MNENQNSSLVGNSLIVNVAEENNSSSSEPVLTSLPQVSIVRSGGSGGSGSVTEINTGVGLTGGPITTTGTIKAKLKSETPSSLASGSPTQVANKQYAVGVDRDGYLSVNVPWDDSDKVKQTPTTTNNTYEVLFSQSADNIEHTEYARKSSNLTYNPSTHALTTGGPVNGYTLAAAAAKSVDTSISEGSTSQNLPTSEAVARYIEDQGFSPSDTTYTFTGGTNQFTALSSKGRTQIVTITPSIANNITGTGQNGSLAQFNGANSIIAGPTFGSDTTLFLRNDGAWDAPEGDQNVQADWNETDSSSDAYIQNKPYIPENVSDLTNDTGFITASDDITGNAATASQLETSRAISIRDGVIGTATYFNGSTDISIPVTDVKDAYVTWGGKNISGDISPDDMGCIDEFGHNKLAYLPAGCIKVEYTIDGGETWEVYSVTDAQKIKMVTTTGSVLKIGGGGYTANTEDETHKITTENMDNFKVRITISTRNGSGQTSGSVYTKAKKWLLNITTNGANCSVLVEDRTIANYNNNADTWNTIGTYTVSGWSGWNSIPYAKTFGGSSTQTSQIADVRFTLNLTNINPSSACDAGFIDFRLIGSTNWTTPSELARAGHLYTIDETKKATFPANVTAGSFTTSGSFTSSGGDVLLTRNQPTGGQQIKWSVGANDYARIYGAATSANNGYLEIATGDDHIEPIYVRQYQGTFDGGYIFKEAKLLDENGNTSFPGALTANVIDATKLSGAIPSAVTATTQTAGDNSTKLATTAFVTKAISDLPEPMIFKGTVASDGSGTITSLPTPAASNEGWTYKVAKAGTYASKVAKLGDTFICAKTGTSTYEWVLIPSGDDIDVTQVSAGTGLNTSGPDSSTDGGNITTTGTLYLTKSGVTAGTYRSVTTDKYGRVTAGTNPNHISNYVIDADLLNIDNKQKHIYIGGGCSGEESGNYSFIYNNTTRYFTMPTVLQRDVLIFNDSNNTIRRAIYNEEAKGWASTDSSIINTTTTAPSGTIKTFSMNNNYYYIGENFGSRLLKIDTLEQFNDIDNINNYKKIMLNSTYSSNVYTPKYFSPLSLDGGIMRGHIILPDNLITEDYQVPTKAYVDDRSEKMGILKMTAEPLPIAPTEEDIKALWLFIGNEPYYDGSIQIYTIIGTETGGGTYHFTDENVNYQFTMPANIEENNILAFVRETHLLYFKLNAEDEGILITTTTGTSGTEITLEPNGNVVYAPNSIYAWQPQYDQTGEIIGYKWTEIKGFTLGAEWDSKSQDLIGRIIALEDFRKYQDTGDAEAQPPLVSVNYKLINNRDTSGSDNYLGLIPLRETLEDTIATEVATLNNTINTKETAVNTRIDGLQTQIIDVDNKYNGYLEITGKGGNTPIFTIKTPKTKHQIVIDNTNTKLIYDNNDMLTIDSEKASSPYLEATQNLAIGNFAFIVRPNGHVTLKKIK